MCLKDVVFIESLKVRQAKNAWDISKHGLHYNHYSFQRQNTLLRENHLRLDERRLKVLKPMNPCMTSSCKRYVDSIGKKSIKHDQILKISTPICSKD